MEKKYPVVLIAGNPNVGKTTLFNALTGLRHKVANYPGVTVEKRSAVLEWSGLGKVEIVDLPGTYSLHGDAIDEVIAVRSILGSPELECLGDLIVVVVDASSLERNLFLTTQIIDLGKPVIVAMNMVDLAERQGVKIYSELLSRSLGVPVVPVIGSSRDGISQLTAEIRRVLLNIAQGDQGSIGSSGLYGAALTPKVGQWCNSGSALYQEAVSLGGKLRDTEDYLGKLHPFGLGLLALVDEKLVPASLTQERLEAVRRVSSEGRDPTSLEASDRYLHIEQVVRGVSKRDPAKTGDSNARLDSLLLHRVWGLFIFAVVMIAMFQAVFTLAAFPMEFLEWINSQIAVLLAKVIPPGIFQSFFVDGVVAGVGSVLVFLPQIMILYGMISLLEDSGYLARVAFLMDRVMRLVGLQGRSFVPLLNSFACAIPGILATRTIPSFADRMRTILIAPLMSCSARLPVFTVLIAAFVPDLKLWGFLSLQGLVLFSMYILGVVVAAVVSLVLKFTIFRGELSELVLELPSYKQPSVKSAMIAAWDRGVVFVRDAGTVILACSVILWFLSSFPKVEGLSSASRVQGSYAGQLGKFIEPLIQPLGFDWKIGVAIVGSFAAREVFVSTLSLVYNLESDDTDSTGLVDALRAEGASSSDNPGNGPGNDKAGYRSHYGLPVALSLMVFYCFSCQCISTLAVCRRETNSLKWPLVMFCYMTILGYVGSFVTFQIFSRWL